MFRRLGSCELSCDVEHRPVIIGHLELRIMPDTYRVSGSPGAARFRVVRRYLAATRVRPRATDDHTPSVYRGGTHD